MNPAFIFILMFLLAACGGNTTPASAPAQASTQTPTHAPTAAPVQAATPAGTSEPCLLTRDQVPADTGRISTGFINAQPVQVHFTLDGPWDFGSGPSGDTLARTIVDAGAAKDAAQFAGADRAVRITSSLFEAGGEQYEFYKTDGAAERALGASFSWSDTSTLYDPPYRSRIFPLRAGNSWRDTYRLKNADGVTLTQVTYEVLSCSTLTVPAGTYPHTMLLRSTAHSLSQQGQPLSVITYYWLSPGVGESAWITSQANEQSRQFTTAANFFRLKETK